MSQRPIPLHVFVSYAHADKDFARRLTANLEGAAVNVWIDHEDLVPGTPNWETAIRQAITNSLLVVFVCSPHSRQSVYVAAELSVAAACDYPIIPVWATGNPWIDCVPLGMVNAQHIDCRADAYTSGLARLVQRINDELDRVVPRHYRLEQFRTVTQTRLNSYEINFPPLPMGCLSFEWPSHRARTELGASPAYVMRSQAFPSLRFLLDELFMSFVRERYWPYTYGRRWLLVEDGHWDRRVVAPLAWLACPDRSQFRLDPTWAMTVKPLDVGLGPGSHWIVAEAEECKGATGVAVNNDRLRRVLERHPKAEYFLLSEGYLEAVPAKTVNPREYSSFGVYLQGFRSRQSVPTVIRETGKPISEDDPEMRYWFARLDDE